MIYSGMKNSINSLLLLFVLCVTAHAQSLLDMHNKVRRQEGLPPFTIDAKLTAAAKHHALAMAKMRPYETIPAEHKEMAHLEPDKEFEYPLHRAIHFGYLPESVLSRPDLNDFTGENAAYAPKEAGPDRLKAKVIFEGWMNSPPHRSAIMGNFQNIGYYRHVTSDGHVYWVVAFGKKE